MPRFTFTRRTDSRDELTVDAPTYDAAEEAMHSAGIAWRTVEASESLTGHAYGQDYPYAGAVADATTPADITVE